MKYNKRSGTYGYSEKHPELFNEELWREYSSAQLEWKTGADENEMFSAGVQWTENQIDLLKKRGQGAVVINAITWATEQLKAMLTANKPRFSATAREDSDRKMAAVFTNLMQYMWQISDGNSELKQAVQDYAVMGRGVLYTYVDPYANSGRGEVKFKSIDPRDVYPDPNTKDYLWRDAAHCLLVSYKTEDQILNMYPEFDMKDAMPHDEERTNDSDRVPQQNQVFSGDVDDANVSIYRIIDRYTKEQVKVHHIMDPYSNEEYEMMDDEYKEYIKKPAISMGGTIMTEDSEVKNALTTINSTGNLEATGPDTYLYQPDPQMNPQTGEMVESQPVMVSVMNIETLINNGTIADRKIMVTRVHQCITIGDKLLYKGHLPTSEYPIVPLNNMWSRTPYPISDVTMVRSLQEMINKLNSLIVANAASSTNQKVLLPRGSQDKSRIEAELNKSGSTVIEYDADIGAPVIFGAQSFPNALFSQVQMYVQMIERQFGIYAIMQGDASVAPQTFKGTIAMDEFGQRRIKSKKDDMESSVNQLAKVMLDYARSVYREEKIIRIVEPNNAVTEVAMNSIKYDDLGREISKFNDISQGVYDIIVVGGSTLPSNRYAQMEYYMEMYKNGLIDQVEVLKKSEVVDVEGVLERFGYIRQLEGQMQQLQEEVKKLRGDLQTAEREEVHAKKRLEVEKFASGLDSIKNRADASRAIQEMQMKQDIEKLTAIPSGTQSPIDLLGLGQNEQQ
jgi:hypothetical protein